MGSMTVLRAGPRVHVRQLWSRQGEVLGAGGRGHGGRTALGAECLHGLRLVLQQQQGCLLLQQQHAGRPSDSLWQAGPMPDRSSRSAQQLPLPVLQLMGQLLLACWPPKLFRQMMRCLLTACIAAMLPALSLLLGVLQLLLVPVQVPLQPEQRLPRLVLLQRMEERTPPAVLQTLSVAPTPAAMWPLLRVARYPALLWMRTRTQQSRHQLCGGCVGLLPPAVQVAAAAVGEVHSTARVVPAAAVAAVALADTAAAVAWPLVAKLFRHAPAACSHRALPLQHLGLVWTLRPLRRKTAALSQRVRSAATGPLPLQLLALRLVAWRPAHSRQLRTPRRGAVGATSRLMSWRAPGGDPEL